MLPSKPIELTEFAISHSNLSDKEFDYFITEIAQHYQVRQPKIVYEIIEEWIRDLAIRLPEYVTYEKNKDISLTIYIANVLIGEITNDGTTDVYDCVIEQCKEI